MAAGDQAQGGRADQQGCGVMEVREPGRAHAAARTRGPRRTAAAKYGRSVDAHAARWRQPGRASGLQPVLPGPPSPPPVPAAPPPAPSPTSLLRFSSSPPLPLPHAGEPRAGGASCRRPTRTPALPLLPRPAAPAADAAERHAGEARRRAGRVVGWRRWLTTRASRAAWLSSAGVLHRSRRSFTSSWRSSDLTNASAPEGVFLAEQFSAFWHLLARCLGYLYEHKHAWTACTFASNQFWGHIVSIQGLLEPNLHVVDSSYHPPAALIYIGAAKPGTVHQHVVCLLMVFTKQHKGPNRTLVRMVWNGVDYIYCKEYPPAIVSCFLWHNQSILLNNIPCQVSRRYRWYTLARDVPFADLMLWISMDDFGGMAERMVDWNYYTPLSDNRLMSLKGLASPRKLPTDLHQRWK
ncbi:hypothetical protein U9M48_043021 [Paspalum notatum var. saurae]|uniref:Uncharacterized protein n=1 Tax=Paspalum notatum var. saurae TaxID=547442 RepID=A0AAQ3UW38_PASNO